MKRFAIKLTALVITGAMCFSLAGCDFLKGGSSRRDRDDDDDDDDGPKWYQTEETSSETSSEPSSEPTETEPSQSTPAPDTGYIETSAELTYPDHVATYEEIHP
nr:hypothetical protein [Saccharofermentans sp.]